MCNTFKILSKSLIIVNGVTRVLKRNSLKTQSSRWHLQNSRDDNAVQSHALVKNFNHNDFKKYLFSLVIWWSTANAGGLGSMPGQGTRSHVEAPRCANYWRKFTITIVEEAISTMSEGNTSGIVSLSLL